MLSWSRRLKIYGLKSSIEVQLPTVKLIVECPMIDHVRWPITHFVRHPHNHVDDVMRCFCSIFNHWSLVARAATCGLFLLKSNDVQTRNLWEGHFLCALTYIALHPVQSVSIVKYFVKIQRNETVLPIFWLVNILIFPKHNYHNLCINFSHVKSAHGQCRSTTGHDAMLDDMLTTTNKSLNFFYIAFDFEV